MNKMKIAIAFAAGLGVGAGAGYFLSKKKLEKDFEDSLNELRELYQQDGQEVVCDRDDIIKNCLETLRDMEYDPETDGTLEDYDMDDDDEEEPDIVNPVDDDDEEEEEEEDEDGPSEFPEGIEEIDKAEFYDGYHDYSEACITMYTDGVLTDDVEDDITDQQSTFFGDIDLQSYETGDTIYFANHTAQLKIELIVSEQSYKRDILGEDDEALGDMAD